MNSGLSTQHFSYACVTRRFLLLGTVIPLLLWKVDSGLHNHLVTQEHAEAIKL